MMQAAAAMQVPLDMMNEEMRGMLTGQIQPRNTIIATRLGITPEMIRQYQGDAMDCLRF
jgi:DNA-directed RNA polymerase sigma subunit (sigma70/sigma32)